MDTMYRLEDGIERLKELQLTLKSAEHWLDNFDRAQKDEPLNLGPYYCALCQAYASDDFMDHCQGCPIFKRPGGRSSCKGTPYGDVLTAVEGGDYEDIIAAVADEYTFLVELAFTLYENEKATFIEETMERR